MRLATFRGDAGVRIGAVTMPALDDPRTRVLDLAGVGYTGMLALIDAGAVGLAQAAAWIAVAPDAAWTDIAAVELLAPLPQPRQMRDGMSFATHIRQSAAGARRLKAMLAGAAAPIQPAGDIDPVHRERPIYYLTNCLNVAGPDSVVHWPSYSRVADFELEIAAVIGRGGRDIPATGGEAHIFGYTIYNDFSARDAQLREMAGRMGPAKGKSFDGGNVLGPWIVTADELRDPGALPVQARVNGEVWARGTTGGMLFSFAEIIAYVSQSETLHAGEVIGSGTVGNCCGLELGRFLRDGDVVELEIEGIGVLRNRIAMPQGSAM